MKAAEIQMRKMKTDIIVVLSRTQSGWQIAKYLSIDIALSVRTDTATDIVWKKTKIGNYLKYSDNTLSKQWRHTQNATENSVWSGATSFTI